MGFLSSAASWLLDAERAIGDVIRGARSLGTKFVDLEKLVINYGESIMADLAKVVALVEAYKVKKEDLDATKTELAIAYDAIAKLQAELATALANDAADAAAIADAAAKATDALLQAEQYKAILDAEDLEDAQGNALIDAVLAEVTPVEEPVEEPLEEEVIVEPDPVFELPGEEVVLDESGVEDTELFPVDDLAVE